MDRAFSFLVKPFKDFVALAAAVLLARAKLGHVMADESCLTFKNLHAIPHLYVKIRMLGRTANSLDFNIQRCMLAIF